MPARELGSSYEPSNGAPGVGITLLKKHKILPHPRERARDPATPATKPRDVVGDADSSSWAGSDTSSPRTLMKHTSRTVGPPVLPPTPPAYSCQAVRSQPRLAPAPKFKGAPAENPDHSPEPATPHPSQSPPTPDVTPPRAMPLAFRPPFSDRHSASRTDSFKTAREDPYSSDEDEASTVRPVPHSARTSAADVRRVPQRVRRREEVGVGLGLISNEGTPTSRLREEFAVFDGEWVSGEEVSEMEREWDDHLTRNVMLRKREGRQPNKQRLLTNEVAQDIVAPTPATRALRGLPLQERIARHRLARDSANRSSTENFAELIAWPAAVADPESTTTPDVRRFSTMSTRSGSSAVVEAVVMNDPPAQRKTLRHSKKRLGLRDFSSEQSRASSAPNAVTFTKEPPHRLHHAAARLPERKHRSLASNTAVNTMSTARSRREVLSSGGIPVVVIPERRSSSKTRPPSLRSTSSRKTKRSNSLTSAPVSQSSKYNEPGYLESCSSRKRTMSESAGSGHSVRTLDFPPNIPARRSSLSASASRNTSRAGSLTAESLKAHNLILEQKQDRTTSPESQRPYPPVEAEREMEAHSNLLNVDHNGDPFYGRRLSTQVTPFSQVSYDTAGTTAEVSEAMAVTLYPHQNKSLLVVQHRPSSEDSPSTLKPTNLSEPLPQMPVDEKPSTGPVTPPQPIHPMDEVDSPLKNPRDPPEPPAIKFIPPTPGVNTPGPEEDRQLGFDMDDSVGPDGKPKRGMSLVRRAFSKRRNSEGSIPTASLLKRTFSLSGGRRHDLVDGSTQTSKERANPSTLYPSVEDRPADAGKLHPFWRPAHFWDDLEGDRQFEDDGYGYPPIDNRPPPPKRSLSQKLKRTFAILPIEDDSYHDDRPHVVRRRTMERTSSENTGVVSSSLGRYDSGRRVYEEHRHSASGPEPGTFGYGFKDGNGGRVHTIPGLGLRVEYVGWSGIKEKLSEKRRAQRSKELRSLISAPKGFKSGMDDVLRKRIAT